MSAGSVSAPGMFRIGKEVLRDSMKLLNEAVKLPDEWTRSWYLARLGNFFMDGGEMDLARAAMDLISRSKVPSDVEALIRCAVLASRLGFAGDVEKFRKRLAEEGEFAVVLLDCRMLPHRGFDSPEALARELGELEDRVDSLPEAEDREDAVGRLTIALLVISRSAPHLLPGLREMESRGIEDPFEEVKQRAVDPGLNAREPLDEMDAALMQIEEGLREQIRAQA